MSDTQRSRPGGAAPGGKELDNKSPAVNRPHEAALLETATAGAIWYPLDIEALADAVAQDGAAFYVATAALTFEEMLARKYPATETTFLPGVSIPPSTPPLPPLCDWQTREARIAVACFDIEGRHQANELYRYLKRSGVGSVKATVA